MSEKLLPCSFAKEAGERIVTSLRRNTFFTPAWEQIDKGIGKKYFENLFAEIITNAWNRRADHSGGANEMVCGNDTNVATNEPLTLDELKQINSEPVYIIHQIERLTRWYIWSNEPIKTIHDGLEGYGKTWYAYRHKKEEGE